MSSALENWGGVEKWARENTGLLFRCGVGPETSEAILAAGRDFIAEAEAIEAGAPAEVALLLACVAYVTGGGERRGATFSGKTALPRRFGLIEGGKGDGAE